MCSLSVSGSSFFHEIQTLQGPSIKGLEGTVQSIFIWWLNKGDPAHLYINFQQEREPELKLWGGGTSAAQEGCFFLSNSPLTLMHFTLETHYSFEVGEIVLLLAPALSRLLLFSQSSTFTGFFLLISPPIVLFYTYPL